MTHELDFSKGRAAIAFSGAVPWHGLGESILPDDDLDTIRYKGGLDYDVRKTPVRYDRAIIDSDGSTKTLLNTASSSCVLYRSDNGADLSVVSHRYQVVQPKEVIEFYRDLTEKYGFNLEVVGALKGGRKVWALANTNEAFALRDNDKVKGYLLLATSYDGTMATQARFTSIRVVCNNTLTWAASEGRADVTVPHSTKFNADSVKTELKVGAAWEEFSRASKEMSNRIVTRDETVRLMLDAYYGLTGIEQIKEFHSDEKNAAKAEKLIERLTKALFESPGAQLASARGTLWGALQAVTYDVDFQSPARTQENRLGRAWFGQGETVKRRAWDAAMRLVA
jgi:phage/plasmid-like protein (TIGR03299 family)